MRCTRDSRLRAATGAACAEGGRWRENYFRRNGFDAVSVCCPKPILSAIILRSPVAGVALRQNRVRSSASRSSRSSDRRQPLSDMRVMLNATVAGAAAGCRCRSCRPGRFERDANAVAAAAAA